MLSVSTLIVGGAAIAILVIGLVSGGEIWLFVPFAASVLIAYFWAWIRVWRVGFKIYDDEVVATSWFTVTTFRRDNLVRWSSESYTGVFYVLGWPIASGRLEAGIVTVDLADGVRRDGRGTATLRTTARDQARFLNGWLRNGTSTAGATGRHD